MLRGVMGAILALALIVAGAGFWLQTNEIKFTRTIEPATMAPEQGLAFVAKVPHDAYLQLKHDGMEAQTASGLVLSENGKPLGPPHSAHADIRAKGAGMFSHWYEAIYFATPDGTDPRTNGRTYSVTYPASLVPTSVEGQTLQSITLASGGVAGLALLALLVVSAQRRPGSRDERAAPGQEHAGPNQERAGPAQEPARAVQERTGLENERVGLSEERAAPNPRPVRKKVWDSESSARARRAAVSALRSAPRFLIDTAGLTVAYAFILLLLYASVEAQRAATGTFKINYEYRAF